MVIVPQLEDFVSDTLIVQVTEDYFVRLVIIDEQFFADGKTVGINSIIVSAELDTDYGVLAIRCPSIIGMSNDLVSIEALDPNYQGVLASKDNFGKWSLTINE